jgi:hypothetical protein
MPNPAKENRAEFLNRPNPYETDNWLKMAAANFAIKLFCGSQCSSANGPRTPAQAAGATKSLTDSQN